VEFYTNFPCVLMVWSLIKTVAINCLLNADSSWNAGRTSVRLRLEDVPTHLRMPTRHSRDGEEFRDLSNNRRTEIY
jgi:hypothetical protein